MTHPLLARARREGTPLIDDGPGDQITATFVRESRRSVRLSGDFDGWARQDDPQAGTNMIEVAPGLWTLARAFPRDVYMEYALFTGTRKSTDPLNARGTFNGVDSRNSFFYGPEAAPSALLRAARGIARGEVTRHTLIADELIAGTSRELWLYRPPVEEPTPLIVVLDGRDYLRRARLPVIVDNLIAQGRVAPVALAMINCSRSARYLEYACSDATVGLLRDIVVPLAATQLPLVDAPGAHAVMGASMGGVMALYAGLRAPNTFGRVLSQSGAFSTDMHRERSDDLAVFDLARHADPAALKIWMDVGSYEDLAACNRRMRDLLRKRGYAHAYREYSAGHNYPAWRDDVSRGLEFLFPPH
ncbi:MAG: esterase family protein [Anaerolineae bacterium]|nr:esterase family protein [Anaerolineae bacterium]